MHAFLRLVACFFFLGLGCNRSTPVPATSAPPVIMVKDNDPEMEKAVNQARATVKVFIEGLKTLRPDQTGFCVKMPVSDGKSTEHMWLSPVRYDGKVFQGIINNQPVQVTGFKLGDSYSVAPEQITDWMFIDRGKLQGGYTIRLLRDRMTPEERKDFERGLGFQFD